MERKIAKQHFCPLWRLIEHEAAKTKQVNETKLTTELLKRHFSQMLVSLGIGNLQRSEKKPGGHSEGTRMRKTQEAW